MNRREFLKLTGLSLAVTLFPEGYRILKADEIKGKVYKTNAWVHISTDNEAIIFINKSEMGQGIYTGLSTLVAEELDFPLKKIKIEPAPPKEEYVDPRMGVLLTGGSTSMIHMFTPMRRAGAVARKMLLMAASKKLNVPLKELQTEDGKIIHTKTGKILTYGEVAELASKLPVPVKVKLKKKSQWKYIEKNIKRIDTEEKVSGKAVFGTDIFIDGIVYATVLKKKWGSYLRKYSVPEPVSKEIVKIFPVTSGIAVCGENIETVFETKQKIKPVWSSSKLDGMSDKDLITYCVKQLSKKGNIAKNRGNVKKAFEKAYKKIEATYTLPYLYHATAEPMSCVVDLKKDKCDVWIPTQAQTSVLRAIRWKTGLPEDKINVYTTYLGGGFGRKSAKDYVIDAVEIAKKVKRPVKLIYSREDDIKSAYFRPIHVCQIEGCIDEEGSITGWKHKIAAPSLLEFARGKKYKVDPEVVRGVRNMPYDIPNLKVEYVKVDFPVPVWFWRSVASSHNAFTVESFIDELSHLANIDPVEMRLDLLFSDLHAQRVIQVAAEKSGWGKAPKYGQAMGIAYHDSFRSKVAQVVEISVIDKQVKIHRVVSVIDIGSITVNPHLIKTQIESAVIMGLSSALYEKVSFKNGEVSSTNFDDYPIMRINETPEIEVHILNSRRVMGGVGEPGLPPVIPALTNAIFKATGKRIRNLPIVENL